MQLRAKISIAGLTLAVMTGCTPKGVPTDADGNRLDRIAFWGQQGTQNAIYITTDGTASPYKKVTDIASRTTSLRLSPDRQRILWIEGETLYTVKTDGTDKLNFGTSLKTLNADWSTDSDTILFEPKDNFQIRKTKATSSTTNELVLDNVYSFSVTKDGEMMTFIPLGSTSVHYSKTDGTSMNSLAAEPAGSNILNPTIDYFKTKITYVVAGVPDGKVKVGNISDGKVNQVSTSVGAYAGWPIPYVNGGPVAMSLTTASGPLIYNLSHFTATGPKTLDSVEGGIFSRVVDAPGDLAVIAYTKSNQLFKLGLLATDTPRRIGEGLDKTGYCDWR